jgi:hypothetical protein
MGKLYCFMPLIDSGSMPPRDNRNRGDGLAINMAFRYEDGALVPHPFILAELDPEKADDDYNEIYAKALADIGFPDQSDIKYGGMGDNTYVSIRVAIDPHRREQEFAFLVLVGLAQMETFIFCRDLREMLAFMQQLTPILRYELEEGRAHAEFHERMKNSANPR